MRIILTIFILLSSSSVLAEDISDFQIEGMSIGDSLLNYFSETEIKSFKSLVLFLSYIHLDPFSALNLV